MTPFQQMLLGSVPSGSKVYVDTVFDTVARVSDGNTYVNWRLCSCANNNSIKSLFWVFSKTIYGINFYTLYSYCSVVS